uniref:Uncharacterized protein n=1 Tax=Denticeps clupeoides TaxID=299321 RepID=A0AAY4CYC4_9TELE
SDQELEAAANPLLLSDLQLPDSSWLEPADPAWLELDLEPAGPAWLDSDLEPAGPPAGSAWLEPDLGPAGSAWLEPDLVAVDPAWLEPDLEPAGPSWLEPDLEPAAGPEGPGPPCRGASLRDRGRHSRPRRGSASTDCTVGASPDWASPVIPLQRHLYA